MYGRSKQAYIYGSKHPKYIEKKDDKVIKPQLTKEEESYQEANNFYKTSKSLNRELDRVDYLK